MKHSKLKPLLSLLIIVFAFGAAGCGDSGVVEPSSNAGLAKGGGVVVQQNPPPQPPPINEPIDIVMSSWDTGTEDDFTDGSLTVLNLADIHNDTEGLGIRVAVVDSGVDASHPKFAGVLEFTGDPADDADFYGHGTMMIGIINRIAPRATIIPIRVFHDPTNPQASELQVAAGLDRALAANVDVVNLSLSSSHPSGHVAWAIDRLTDAGIIVCSSAGNTYGGNARFPSTMDNVIGFAATDAFDAVHPMSAVGSEVEMAAPGVYVGTTGMNNTYVRATGTSVASAVGAGFSALCLAIQKTNRDPELVVDSLYDTAAPITPINAAIHGRIHHQAFSAAAGRMPAGGGLGF